MKKMPNLIPVHLKATMQLLLEGMTQIMLLLLLLILFVGVGEGTTYTWQSCFRGHGMLLVQVSPAVLTAQLNAAISCDETQNNLMDVLLFKFEHYYLPPEFVGIHGDISLELSRESMNKRIHSLLLLRTLPLSLKISHSAGYVWRLCDMVHEPDQCQ